MDLEQEIKGITAEVSGKLAEQGILDRQSLLAKGTTLEDRRALARATALSERELLAYANRADLQRVKGVGREYSDLLELAGVDTVKELRTRKPENLHKALVEANQEKSIVQRLPTLAQVVAWVEFAKTLPESITY